MLNKPAFDKLKPEKQKRILNAAFNEFSKYPYDKCSVFQIAKNAKISRASFYFYFSDKKDIYLYILNKLKCEIFSDLKIKFDAVDSFDVILKLFYKFVEFKGTDIQNFIEMFFKNSTPTTQNIFVSDINSPKPDLKCKMDLSKYTSEITESQFLTLIDMVFYGMLKSLHFYYQDKINKQDVLESFNKITYYSINGILKEKQNAWTKRNC